MKRIVTLVAITFVVLAAPNSKSCTTFTLLKNGHVVYGRNLDWHADSGLICVNPRGVTKKALVLALQPRPTHPAEWTSKLGSLTFNSLGKEFPTGGINEAGLVVDVMWLDQTRYPKADDRPEVGPFQWTQYLLDTCRNIGEVLTATSKVRVSEDGFPPHHFLICDREGNTAVIEFLEGKMSVRKGTDLPYTTLANSTYEESLKQAGQCRGLGGQDPVPEGPGSLERFARAAAAVKAFSGSERDMVGYSFDVLHSVNAGYELNQHSTVWSIVYDVTGRKVHFRTNSNRKTRVIDLARLNFSNTEPAQVWPILGEGEGDITGQSVPYSKALNREMVVRQVSNPGVVGIFGDMSRMVDLVAAYPETCGLNKE